MLALSLQPPRAPVWAMALAAIGLSAAASAHPHVWTTVETEVLYDADRRVSGFRQKWTFDEYYSAFASQGLDKNGDGALDRTELAPLAEENVTSLKEFDYFTFVTVDGEAAQLLEPRDYWLEQAHGVLVLHFTLPLEEPVDARLGKVSFSIYDPTYYVAFEFAKESPVRLVAAAPKGCEPRLGRDAGADAAQTQEKALSESFFSALGPGSDFGGQFAQSVTIDCRGR